MKSPALLLIFLISLMFCLASGCTQYREIAGGVLEKISADPGPDSTGNLPGRNLDPTLDETTRPVTTETTASPTGTIIPTAVITTTTTDITLPTTVTTPPTTVTTPPATTTTIPTTVTTTAATATTPTADVTTPDTTVTTPLTTGTAIPTTTSTPPAGGISQGVEQWVFRLTNEERAKEGIAPLVWDEPLAVVARAHSTDMADHHFFSHTNLQGEGPTERAERHGYPVRKDLGGGYYSVGIGENLNQMPTGNVVDIGYVNNDAESIARAQVKAFMASPGHRALILKGEFTNLGVGTAYDGTYYYTTQNFW